VSELWVIESSPVSRKMLEAYAAKCELDARCFNDTVSLLEALSGMPPDYLWLGLPLDDEERFKAFMTNFDQGELQITVSSHSKEEGQLWVDAGLAHRVIQQPVRLEAFKECFSAPVSEPASVQANPTQKETIDWTLLDEISGGWDDDFIVIVEDFLVDIEKMFSDLLQMNELPVTEEKERAAHSLKGSSANFGLTRFSAMMAEAEQCYKRGDLISQELLGEAEIMLQSGTQQIRDRLNQV